MEVDVKVTEEFLKQEFFIESTITTTVVHKVYANSPEQAKHFVKMGFVNSANVVDTHAHKEIDDVTEKYKSLLNEIEETLKGRGL